MPRAGSCLSFARAGFAAARFPVAVRLVSLTRSRRVSGNAECGSRNGNPPGHSAVSRSLESSRSKRHRLFIFGKRSWWFAVLRAEECS